MCSGDTFRDKHAGLQDEGVRREARPLAAWLGGRGCHHPVNGGHGLIVAAAFHPTISSGPA
ncbi:hypothetical protein E2C01_086628 [Portunus trituberculatus]|uniref:Uncharacterized protein n=1 Tax=Portunus trituberculatus TaxID=210409 RepID=A0A5B7J5X2_PORTR|nr:hypothetical protein [Portunus trituberculatus]